MSQNGMSVNKETSNGVSLKDGVRSMMRKGLYADLTIRCNNGSEHKVHKVVVCSQSRFFHNACKPDSPFKEAQTGVIELAEDDPKTVKAMITFMYEEKYEYHPDQDDDYAPEDYDYDSQSETEEEDDDIITQDIMFHLHCFLLADKYEVSLMMLHAALKVRDKMQMYKYHLNPDFPRVVRFIYEKTTPSINSGRRLRDIILKLCVENLTTLYLSPRFENVLSPVNDFWKELARAQAKIPQAPPTWVQCPQCAVTFPALLHPDPPMMYEELSCAYCCKEHATHAVWKKRHALPPPEDVKGPWDITERMLLLAETMKLADALMASPRKRQRRGSDDSFYY
ncbi:BTB/POZ domain containing protein [Lasiodiplodia theobromae]|uniref:BTB/POZ domain containing protein n=1 Tax=Lasiodiplodia theobromae TaxID=45133 RepID=UPI0015C360EC|nr:BTB/POZ domain containing protein [Lasiodiplodia theobromae]KAF4541513.1 BTB/POZ domain containing protein [Lasiodiplodia theobromae]